MGVVKIIIGDWVLMTEWWNYADMAMVLKGGVYEYLLMEVMFWIKTFFYIKLVQVVGPLYVLFFK